MNKEKSKTVIMKSLNNLVKEDLAISILRSILEKKHKRYFNDS